MALTRTIDVQDFMNPHKLSSYQIRIIALCFLIVAIDGFDTAAIGFIAPALRAEWGVTAAQLAPLFGAGLFGLMVGAFIFGPLADKIGRKYALVLTVIFFGGASLASAWSTSITELTILRFLTGMGLGGAMPNAITLTSEFCPEKRRSFLTTLMFCGFTLGSAFGGLAAAQMVAGFGWESVLLLGGILPLALAPVLWLTLPESVRFLVLKNAPAEQITAVLHKIAPEADLSGATYTGVTKPKGSPVRQLFQPGLVSGTLLIWLTFFMSLLVFYLLSSWLPTVISSAGMTLKEASLMAMMLQLGGTAGALADRRPDGPDQSAHRARRLLRPGRPVHRLDRQFDGVAVAAVPGRVRRRVLPGRVAGRRQCAGSRLLPDRQPRHRRRLGQRRRPQRVGAGFDVRRRHPGQRPGPAGRLRDRRHPGDHRRTVHVPQGPAGAAAGAPHGAGGFRRDRHRESRFAALRQQPEEQYQAPSTPPGTQVPEHQSKKEEDHETSRHHRRDHRIGPAQEG